MTQPSDLEVRVAALEARIEEVASDATAARHLAAARDRDLADLGGKVDGNRTAIDANRTAIDANRPAINALGVQTAEGFARVDRGFAEIRGRLDQTAAGQQQIADMLATLINRQDGQ